MRSLSDVAKTLAVFCYLGPLIGLLIFAAGSSLRAIASGTTDGFWIFPFMLIYGIIFVHFAGIVWAVLAAVISIAIAFALKRTAMWIGPMSGAISFLVSAYSKFGLFGGPILLAEGQSAFAAVVAATHIGAAWGSWAIARQWLGTPESAAREITE